MLLGLAGSVYAIWRRTAADVVLLSYAIINYVVIASTTSTALFYPRYALPIIVVLSLLAGRLAADMLGATRRMHWAPIAAMLAVLLIVPARQESAVAYALTQPDSRTQAKEWFEANVPAGSRVLIEGGKISTMRETVPLQDSREAMLRRIEYYRQVEPKQAQYLELELAVHQGVGYDLELVRLESMESLDFYLAQGIEYFVLRPDAFQSDKRRAGSASAKLVTDLRTDSRVTLMKRFEGDSPTQIGPTIEVYHLIQKPDDARSPPP
jgi:hypothetical protein